MIEIMFPAEGVNGIGNIIRRIAMGRISKAPKERVCKENIQRNPANKPRNCSEQNVILLSKA
jgi:hypothetical protein